VKLYDLWIYKLNTYFLMCVLLISFIYNLFLTITFTVTYYITATASSGVASRLLIIQSHFCNCVVWCAKQRLMIQRTQRFEATPLRMSLVCEFVCYCILVVYFLANHRTQCHFSYEITGAESLWTRISAESADTRCPTAGIVSPSRHWIKFLSRKYQ